MDIVVRTPHGDADVSIVSHTADATLADLIGEATGQAIPKVAQIDGRTVNSETPLAECGLVAGTVIDTDPAMPEAAGDEDVLLTQLTGHGAGRSVRLAAGRYRIGPGRRVSADELIEAPVEQVRFELIVGPCGDVASGQVRVGPAAVNPAAPDAQHPHTSSTAVATPEDEAPTSLWLDGEEITAARAWTHGILIAGVRAFTFDRAPVSPARRQPPPGASGAHPGDAVASGSRPDTSATITFNRPPRRSRSEPRQPVATALADAALAGPRLWERRPGDADAFVLPVGLRAPTIPAGTQRGTRSGARPGARNPSGPDRPGGAAEPVDAAGAAGQTVLVDIGNERGVAIAGDSRFQTALARALVVEATTIHGPADLEIVVVTQPDRVGQWDWMKWLPHVRIHGEPTILSTDRAIGDWAENIASREAAARRDPGGLTLVVVDSPDSWLRRRPPLHPIITGTSNNVRLLTLCDEVSHAPALCTSVISQNSDGTARLSTPSTDTDQILPSLVDVGVATRLARALAPLVDADLSVTPPTPAARTTGHDIVAFLGLDTATAHEICTRWQQLDSQHPVSVVVGHHDASPHDTSPVGLTVDTDNVIISGSSFDDAIDVASTIVLGMCLARSPDALWVTAVGEPSLARSARIQSRLGVFSRLPHAAPPAVDDETDARRLIARVDHVLDDPAGPSRVVVFVALGSDDGFVGTLVEAASARSGLTVVVITEQPVAHLAEEIRQRCGTTITVDHRAGRRHAMVTDRGELAGSPFVPFQPRPRINAVATHTVQLRPAVFGRALTPLERRLDQRVSNAAISDDPNVTTVVRLLVDATAAWRADRSGGRDRGRGTAFGSTGAPSPIERVIAPPPLPPSVGREELFDALPGDGVPIGLIDRPASLSTEPMWWQPGDGSLLLFGSQRSGMASLLVTIVLGIVDRFAADDIEVVAIDTSPSRRRSLGRADHVTIIADAAQRGQVSDVLDRLDAVLGENPNDSSGRHLSRRRNAGEHDMSRGRLLVLINDLGQLRRNLADPSLDRRLDSTLGAAMAEGSGVDVIAYVSDLTGAGTLVDRPARRLVGASDDLVEMAALGVTDPASLGGYPGRCRVFPGDDLVQLALGAESLEDALDRRFADEVADGVADTDEPGPSRS